MQTTLTSISSQENFISVRDSQAVSFGPGTEPPVHGLQRY